METELKLSLEGSHEAERLLDALPAPQQIHRQRNVYFDDPGGLWAAMGVSVRLRWIEESCILTVKGEGETREGFALRPEAERRLDPSEIPLLREGGTELVSAALGLASQHGMELEFAPLANTVLRPVGEMMTLRRRCELPSEFGDAPILEIDETTYPDASVVWEAELEANREGADLVWLSRRLQEFFASAGVSWRPSMLSKRRRLAQILDRMLG